MKKAYLYHIGLNNDLSNGYIGITCCPQKRFDSHKCSKQGYKITSKIKEHNLSKDDMRILCIGDLTYIRALEKKLRPHKNIGWNIAKGGGGANNVGETAYNYNPDYHIPCKDCGGKTSGVSIRCMACYLEYSRKTSVVHSDSVCKDCGEYTGKKGFGDKYRCRKCFKEFMKTNNPSKAIEPYIFVNINTGERVELEKGIKQWCLDHGMSHKALSRFSEIRNTIRHGSYGKPRGDILQRRFEYKGWTLDERVLGKCNYPATKKIFNCGNYGVFYSYSEIMCGTGFGHPKVTNMLHRDNTGWTVAEVDLLEWIDEQQRNS